MAAIGESISGFTFRARSLRKLDCISNDKSESRRHPEIKRR